MLAHLEVSLDRVCLLVIIFVLNHQQNSMIDHQPINSLGALQLKFEYKCVRFGGTLNMVLVMNWALVILFVLLHCLKNKGCALILETTYGLSPFFLCSSSPTIPYFVLSSQPKSDHIFLIRLLP